MAVTVITGKTNSGLVTYAKAQLGLPYWYGTFGQIATESLYQNRRNAYPSYYKSWSDFPTQYGKRVHDCVGLIKGYMWSDTPTSVPNKHYNSKQDVSACGMYSNSTLKGTISSFPAHVGQLVYKSSVKTDAKKIHHVGVYIGDGYVIEAKGHEYGVVKTKFDNAGWTHWSQCPYITDDTSTQTGRSYAKDHEGIYKITGNTVYIRESPGTVDRQTKKSTKILGVLKKNIEVNCNGYFTTIDSREWLEVKAPLNGVTVSGWVSTKYLKKV